MGRRRSGALAVGVIGVVPKGRCRCGSVVARGQRFRGGRGSETACRGRLDRFLFIEEKGEEVLVGVDWINFCSLGGKKKKKRREGRVKG